MYDYQLGLYEKAMPDDMPLTEKLLLTRELGYDYMELCVDLAPERAARLDWTKEERWKLMDFMHKNDLHFTTLSLSVLRGSPMGDSDESAATFLKNMEKGLQLACDIGARVILFNGYDTFKGVSTPETRDRFYRYLPQAAALAARYGVVIGIENAEKEIFDSVTKVAACIRRINSPWLRVYGDIGNTANAVNGDPSRAIMDLCNGRGLVAAMHLKDSVPGDYRSTPYGSGHVDFPKSVSVLKDLGVRIFTAELFMRTDVDYKEEARRVCKFLRSFF